MNKTLIFRSIRSRFGLYLPMTIAVSVTLCLIGAAGITDSSFRMMIDRQMEHYGANVILRNPDSAAVAEGVAVEVQTIRMEGVPVERGITSLPSLLNLNPAWLVRGDGPHLVGQDAAARLHVGQGDRLTIDNITGTVAVLETGTRFDQFIFTEGVASDPAFAFIQTDRPEQYKGSDAVILAEMVASKYTVLNSIGRLMLIIAVLSALASVATVTNLVRVDADRRRKEFGIFKSLGASSEHIITLMGLEYLVLSGITLFTGIAGSLALSSGILFAVTGELPSLPMGTVLLPIVLADLVAFGGAGITYVLESKRINIAEVL